MEQADDSIVHTALRETQEELDHSPDLSWVILGQCTSVPSIKGMPVTPVVAVLDEALQTDSLATKFPGSADEVESVFALSVDELLEGETSKPLGRIARPAPVFPCPPYGEIWGLTAFVLRPILHQVLKPVYSGV